MESAKCTNLHYKIVTHLGRIQDEIVDSERGMDGAIYTNHNLEIGDQNKTK